MSIERVVHRLLVLSIAVLGLMSCSPALETEQIGEQRQAVTVPSGFSDETLVSGLASPTALAFTPDGRLFVTQQGGRLRVIKNGALLSTPFVTLSVNSSGERGLLGVAIDPNFASNGYVYLYYTSPTPTVHNRISRFTASGDVAVAGSELVLMDLETLGATNHNGGALHFGPDGKLYIAVGENATRNNAQTLSNRLGKILRINSDGSIPSDNPFFTTATGANRAIWSLGLRNPFTFAFQAGTGRMFINDVGESTWEEINEGVAGSNYGWPITEGTTSDARFRSPIFVYPHGSGGTSGCAITGGVFYNPSVVQFPSSYVGKYFFGDYCNNWIRVLDPATGSAQAFASAVSGPVDLQVGPDGLLYYVAIGSGTVGRIRATTSQPPAITSPPSSVTVAAGQTATFSVAATGTQPLTYQWQRGTTNISGATSASYSLVAGSGDNGATFRVVVTNAFGTVTSNSATLTVSSNAAPVATITTPASGALYSAGDTIAYSGTGTDAEDGTLPASAFTWEVVFHHASHTHPFVPPTSGSKTGSFTIPKTGELATDVFYRIHLTVKDSAGLTHTTTRDVLPRVSTISLRTSPPGLQLSLDGTPVTTPVDVPSVVGMTRQLGVVSPQTSGGSSYAFSSWSDGGAASHNIDTPSTNTTYTATYAATTGGGLTAQYFDNLDFTNLKLTRVDPGINFDFGTGSPDPAIGADTFSVRWTGTITPAFSEAYTLYTTSDDGIRVRLNGALVIDNFTDHGPTENSGTTVVLSAGQAYSIQVEFYENGGGAVAKLSWSSPSQPKQIVPASRLAPAPVTTGGGLTGRYFDNADFTSLKLTRTDASINFDFGTGSPDPLLGADTFSVRWTGTITPAFNEAYTLYTTSDDGIRVTFNGAVLINNFTDHSPVENSGTTVVLSAGQAYPIQIDFYENGGGAVAKLSWSSPSQPKQIVPTARLTPEP
jgi:glucose/arabinose dehydrogenase